MTKPGTKHRQLADALKKRIGEGVYKKGVPFPSERALIRQFGYSRVTVQHALRELEADGLIVRRQGRGTFVTASGASRQIGLIVPGVACTDFFQPIVCEINQLARKEGYRQFESGARRETRRDRRRECVTDGPDRAGERM